MACMTDAARRAKREYMRKWRATHKESIQRSDAKYWARKAKEMGLDTEEQEPEDGELEPNER